MILELVTAPTLLPVSVTEAANFCKVNTSDDNQAIETIIQAARDKCEALAYRTLLTTTLDLKLPSFPRVIDLPRPPVASVTSVSYYDLDNVLKTLTVTTQYLTYCGNKTARVYLHNGGTWPSTYDRPDAVVVRYVAGWTAASLVPSCLRQWVLEAVSTMYQNREMMVTGTIATELPREFCAGLLDPERLVSYY
jgi:uncharacterized phiE125 gp8 family phage protein